MIEHSSSAHEKSNRDAAKRSGDPLLSSRLLIEHGTTHNIENALGQLQELSDALASLQTALNRMGIAQSEFNVFLSALRGGCLGQSLKLLSILQTGLLVFDGISDSKKHCIISATEQSSDEYQIHAEDEALRVQISSGVPQSDNNDVDPFTRDLQVWIDEGEIEMSVIQEIHQKHVDAQILSLQQKLESLEHEHKEKLKQQLQESQAMNKLLDRSVSTMNNFLDKARNSRTSRVD